MKLIALTTLLFCFSCVCSAFSGYSSSVYCEDAEQCEDDSLTYTDVYCYGYYGCESSDITATKGYIYGAYAAYEATVDAKYTYGYGLLALSYANLVTYIGEIRGYLTCYYADIEPYSDTLYLYLYGYFAGYYADVFCYSGDSCHIDCGYVYGCYDLSFYCYSGSTCYYDCDDDSDYCPTMYSGVSNDTDATAATHVFAISENSKLKEHKSGLSDDEITAFYQERKANKQSRGFDENSEIDIDFDSLPNGEEMKREYNKVMAAAKATRNGSKHSKDVFDKVMNSGYFVFVAGMVCMLALRVVYSIWQSKQKMFE